MGGGVMGVFCKGKGKGKGKGQWHRRLACGSPWPPPPKLFLKEVKVNEKEKVPLVEQVRAAG
jgi:hypothetical protein